MTWRPFSVGPDGNVYVGDIGDNLGGGWSEVWIYRFAEPERLRDTTVTATRYTVRYADGPRDAESLMVHPKTGRVYIASKSEKNGAVYAGPEQLSPTGVNTFRRIARTEVSATDGAFSPDGTRLVLRELLRRRDVPLAGRTGQGPRHHPVTVPVHGAGRVGDLHLGRPYADVRCGRQGQPVDPLELEGELLPSTVKPADDAARARAAAASGGDGQLDNRDVVVGGAAFAAAVVLWMGLRRVFRRRG